MPPRTLVKKKRTGMRLAVFLTREHMDELRSDARVIVRGLCEIGGGPIEGQTETLAQLEKHVDEARSFTELAWWVKQITRSYILEYEDRVRQLQTGSRDLNALPTSPFEEGQGGELDDKWWDDDWDE